MTSRKRRPRNDTVTVNSLARGSIKVSLDERRSASNDRRPRRRVGEQINCIIVIARSRLRLYSHGYGRRKGGRARRAFTRSLSRVYTAGIPEKPLGQPRDLDVSVGDLIIMVTSHVKAKVDYDDDDDDDDQTDS